MIKAIAREHIRKSRKRPDRHPLVTRTLNLIAKRQEELEIDKQRAAALFDEETFAAPSKITQGDNKPAEDRKESASARMQREVQTRTESARQGIRRALRGSPRLVSRRPSMT